MVTLAGVQNAGGLFPVSPALSLQRVRRQHGANAPPPSTEGAAYSSNQQPSGARRLPQGSPKGRGGGRGQRWVVGGRAGTGGGRQSDISSRAEGGAHAT